MEHKFLTKKELCERWGITSPTIEKYLAEGVIKTFRKTNYFPQAYIEALENENINLDAVNAFAYRTLQRKYEQAEKENAELKSRLLHVGMLATEGIKNIIEKAI